MTVDAFTPIHVRDARPADVPELVDLIRPFVEQRKLLPRDADELTRLTTNGFIAEAGGCIVGFAAVEVYSKKLAEIQCLAVAAEFQMRGVGKQLVNCCVDRARDLKVLEVMAISASDQFLKECGFDYSLPDQKRALFIQTRDT